MLGVGPVWHPVLVFVVAGMIGGAWSRIMTHDTIFWYIAAGMTNQTIFHLRLDFVAIKVFPVSDAGVAFCAIELLVFTMGKNKALFQALALSFSFARGFQMAQGTVAFFPGLEMTLQTAFFTRAAKAVINLIIVWKNKINSGGNHS